MNNVKKFECVLNAFNENYDPKYNTVINIPKVILLYVFVDKFFFKQRKIDLIS